MTAFYFVRHGETDANRLGRFAGRTDLPLNGDGVLQSQTTAKKLEREAFAAVYCGSALRVRQTFELVRPAILFPENKLFFADDIREVDFGEWENRTAEEIRQGYPALWQAYMDDWAGFTFPGGDSVRLFFARCGRFIRGIARQYKGEKIAIFGHKGFNLACACALENKPASHLFSREAQNGSFFLLKTGE